MTIDARYQVVMTCLECRKHEYGPDGYEWCGRTHEAIRGRQPGEVPPDCPLPSMADVERLREAARVVVRKENPCSFEWDELAAAIDALDKGKEKI